jgi:tetratricopeptide (TPR) repeat protein
VDLLSTQEEALERAEEFEGMGFDPVCVHPSSEGPTVRIGEFDIYMDAFLLFESLRDVNPGTRLRYNSLENESSEGREWQFQSLTAPASSRDIFQLVRRPLGDRHSLHFSNPDCPIADGGIWVPSDTPVEQVDEEEIIEAEAALEFAAESATVTGASLVLARSLALNGDLQGVRTIALPVANGTLAASPEVRYEAMWLMARTYHALKWRRTAYRAYKEIESIATHPVDILRCQVERAGLLLELAHSGSGQMADNRLLCSRIVERHSEADLPEARTLVATAALMRAETYQIDNDPEQALVELRHVAEQYADVAKVRAMALYFTGFALCDAGRYEESFGYFEQIARMRLSSEHNFPRLDLSPQSYRNLVLVAIRNGLDEEAEEYFLEFADAYPGNEWLEQSAKRLRYSEYISDDTRQIIARCLDDD